MLLAIRNFFRTAVTWCSIHIPYINALTYFPLSSHKTAIQKFLILWLLTSLPVGVAAVLSPIPLQSTNILFDLGLKLREAISVSEQFVYTAAYLSPILYILWEKYQFGQAQRGADVEELARVFRGYGWVAGLSLVIIILTATAFSALKTGLPMFRTTFLHQFLVTNAGWIYLFALYCFYLSILDGNFAGDFVVASRQSEDRTSDDFSARIRNRSQ